MKKTIACALGLLVAWLVACGGGVEDLGSSRQALTLPTQPFPGFIIPGLVGATSGFGASTPIGLATTAGLGVGTAVNIENLINASGVYHNDYGWFIPASRDQICNLAAPTICLSGIPPVGSTNVVLTTSSDPNSFGLVGQGGMLKSVITGNCIQAAALANGAALHWSACSAGTPFAGIGFHETLTIDSSGGGLQGVGVTPVGLGLWRLQGSTSSVTFTTAMDAAYFEVIGWQSPANGVLYAQPVNVSGSPYVGFSSRGGPLVCSGSTTETNGSWSPTALGISGPCNGPWMYGATAGSAIYIGAGGSDTSVIASYF